MERWKQALCDQLKILTGHTITDREVFSDDHPLGGYTKGLQDGRPLIMKHSLNSLLVVLPQDDFRKLATNVVSIDDYINTSYWNYGYIWPTGGIISSVYWQPLEKGPGIHDKRKICRYLNMISCKIDRLTTGSSISKSKCNKCYVNATSCPYSPCHIYGLMKVLVVQEPNEKKRLFDELLSEEIKDPDERRKLFDTIMEEEISEHDERKEIFEAIKRMLQKEMSFSVRVRSWHSMGKEKIVLKPILAYKNTVEAMVDYRLLNDVLYMPERRNWDDEIKNFSIVLLNENVLKGFKSTEIPKDVDKRKFCLDFWEANFWDWETIDSEENANIQPDSNVDSNDVAETEIIVDSTDSETAKSVAV